VTRYFVTLQNWLKLVYVHLTIINNKQLHVTYYVMLKGSRKFSTSESILFRELPFTSFKYLFKSSWDLSNYPGECMYEKMTFSVDRATR
jgi:hypothetical protein